MPEDAPPNGGAPGPRARVLEMQAKLHRWAVADPGRRFDDLFNFVHDPATLLVAFDRVAGNRGARTPGVDGLTATDVEESIGVPGFLNDLRAAIKGGSFRPMPVRERSIPKPGGSGKVRKLGIPTIADRVVQAALKLVLEPIFEADFKPVSYGFRPRRRAQDAIAEIHYFGTRGYRWVLDADIEACFDSIDHTALMDRVRHRVKDKRVLMLIKAFLKAGILTELGETKEALTGTPQGGILSPLLANIALSALDEHLHESWEPGGTMSTEGKRAYRRRKGRPTWRVVRYADDFVVLVHGTETDTAALREEVADVLEPLGLRLSQAKTRIAHMSDGFEFLGFRIQWKRKGGTNKWHVYTFIADRPIRSLKAKVRALTGRTSQQELATVLIRLTQIMRGWANYFKHAVAKHVFTKLDAFVWWRLIRMLRERHRWSWGDVRRRFTTPTGRWLPIAADGIELFQIASVTVSRYRYRASTIPNPWHPANPV
ncbi:group II intron reverse transcriptase/maturase [Streptomyces lydicus]|uniref:Group II intron reverse transcriptase/maturase n=1 Tax=Streptomyces lydicus TaxID=47763 RepID=A0A3Q9KFB0_9ACTN|nr:group II intron reverse transcriptase/maturase [Streptomyces lydicus]AZS75590.1 group II intron reverse transcriptase/maturase [Streptomyces lydicus]AZS76046.1 group II intron reverse transcriptase/maturase [Streptomyces lydicus]